jgi:flagellar L-ring protein precursor FlgH
VSNKVYRREVLRVALSLVTLSAALACFGADVGATDAPASAASRSLFADRTAHRPGDILTVVITENSSASATARTTADRSDSVVATLQRSNAGINSLDASLGSDFKGGGQIERSGKLIAKLSVVVDQVDANGNLTVHGEQEIEVNNERQHIKLNGMVRPEDIGADNTIPSWRVSDAKIEFTGKGLLARKQSPGLLTRILGWFGIT